jgi:hypothetical protein
MSTGEDLPMISLPSDSTQVELTPQKEVPVTAPEPRRNPTTDVKKLAPPGATADPRLGSDARRPAAVAPAKPAAAPAPAASATRPAAPAVRAPIPQAAGGEDEDPEKLLREYAERQKTKVVRLEQQVIEYKKVVAERDSLRAKVDALGKELQDARRQIDVAAKSDEVIKDLQGKVDAAILSNSILSEDKNKLKTGLSQQTDHLKKSEERAEKAEKSLAEAQKKVAEETAGRQDAEDRVAAALDVLQGGGDAASPDAPEARPAAKTAPAERPVSEMATRPMKAPVEAPEEKQAPAAAAKPPVRPPGRFSFLKK